MALEVVSTAVAPSRGCKFPPPVLDEDLRTRHFSCGCSVPLFVQGIQTLKFHALWHVLAAHCRLSWGGKGGLQVQRGSRSMNQLGGLTLNPLPVFFWDEVLGVRIWERTFRPGDIVLDATCGNGNDTLVLARLAFGSQPTTGMSETSAETGSPQRALVYALDIQPQALQATRSMLATQLSPAQMERVKFVETCHSKLGDFVPPGSARLVSFNLGYLPGGDKNVVTRAASTEAALTAALTAVAPGGLITIVAYVGHPEGRMEYDSVFSFVESLPPDKWVCSHHQWANRRQAPSLFLLYKK